MPFWNRPRLSPDFIAVPHEPSAAERAAGPGLHTSRDVVGLIDGLLRKQSELYAEDRNDELVDALLTIRNALTVPVIPGRRA